MAPHAPGRSGPRHALVLWIGSTRPTNPAHGRQTLLTVLARSYEFADSAKHFLLDAKRTKDANSQQHSGELVHLPSSLASREAEHLLKRDSDRCCETTRPVPGGPPAQLGAVAAAR
jgi:hypothetical protein